MDPNLVEYEAIDLLDCFNEDLVWIVDRLVTRVGGSFGLITRHVQGEDPIVLAATTEIPPGIEGLFPALAIEASLAVSAHRRRHDDVVCMRESNWTPEPEKTSTDHYRLLQLGFAPTHNVSLVASVCRQDASTPYHQIGLATATRLYPVLSRYIRLWWLHRMERRRANALSAALDLSDVGVMLLDRQSHLLFANIRANALLDRQDGLTRNEGSIAATEARDSVRFQAAIQHALHWNLAPPPGSEPSPPAPILTLRRAGQRRALIAAVMHIQRPAIDLRDPALIIYVFDPEQDLERLLIPVCEIYKLTGAEARLVHHLIGGLRISEIAKRMRVQPDTVRAYLKQVFLKTATNRQVDLMRLMLTSMLRTNARIDLALLSAFD